MKKFTSMLCIALVILASSGWSQVLAAGPSTTAVSDASFDPTHEIVCECDCGGELQTYQYFQNMACSRFDGISCEYDEGSTSTLSGCEKKAQPIENENASPFQRGPTITSVGQIHSRPIQQQPLPVLKEWDFMDGVEMDSWLDQLSNNLFGTTYPGLVLDEVPGVVGNLYTGFTAVGQTPFSFDLLKVNKTEIVQDYVDPVTFQVFDLEIKWVQGSILSGSATETTGLLSTTARFVNDPTQELTFILPLGKNYPYPLIPGASRAGFDTDAFSDEIESKLEFISIQPADGEDACDGCKNDANRDIGRVRSDFKSCLKWSAIGGLVGGLIGLSGGNPVTVLGGAALGAEIVALACADTAAGDYANIIEDFCACLGENDCPPHDVCTPDA